MSLWGLPEKKERVRSVRMVAKMTTRPIEFQEGEEVKRLEILRKKKEKEEFEFELKRRKELYFCLLRRGKHYCNGFFFFFLLFGCFFFLTISLFCDLSVSVCFFFG